MDKKWIIGVNLFAILLLIIIVGIPLILGIIEGENVLFFPPTLISMLLAIFFSINLFKRKNWARIVFLWIVWITCISISIGGYGLAGNTANAITFVLTTLAIAGVISFFLTHHKVKEQFKKNKGGRFPISA